jgi:hypothetical protein
MIRKTCTALAMCLSVIVAASSGAFATTVTTTLSVTAIVDLLATLPPARWHSGPTIHWWSTWQTR